MLYLCIDPAHRLGYHRDLQFTSSPTAYSIGAPMPRTGHHRGRRISMYQRIQLTTCGKYAPLHQLAELKRQITTTSAIQTFVSCDVLQAGLLGDCIPDHIPATSSHIPSSTVVSDDSLGPTDHEQLSHMTQQCSLYRFNISQKTTSWMCILMSTVCTARYLYEGMPFPVPKSSLGLMYCTFALLCGPISSL